MTLLEECIFRKPDDGDVGSNHLAIPSRKDDDDVGGNFLAEEKWRRWRQPSGGKMTAAMAATTMADMMKLSNKNVRPQRISPAELA